MEADCILFQLRDLPAAVNAYQDLTVLTQRGVATRLIPPAAAALGTLGEEPTEPSHRLDAALLEAATKKPDPAPLLCLRCRVSHPLEAWLRATHRAHHKSHGLDLLAMASYALDDDGALTIRKGPSETAPFTYAEIASRPPGLISPFSAEVIRTYDPSRCGVPHWARLKIQAHNGLKAYFRENGLLLISDWALLRNSSTRRVREACERHLRSASTVEALLELHRRYGPLYDQAKQAYKARSGKASGWQPDLPFLQELAPQSEPFATQEQLLAIARAVRQLLSGAWQQSLDQASEQGFEPADPRSLEPDGSEEPSSADLVALIDAALDRAMAQHLPSLLASGQDQALLRRLWAGWAEGLTNRPLAERCGTSCGTVSKKLRPTKLATTIATTAALELKRHSAFASCGKSVEAAEQLVLALRNHLLEPEREGEVALLRRWVHRFLLQP